MVIRRRPLPVSSAVASRSHRLFRFCKRVHFLPGTNSSISLLWFAIRSVRRVGEKKSRVSPLIFNAPGPVRLFVVVVVMSSLSPFCSKLSLFLSLLYLDDDASHRNATQSPLFSEKEGPYRPFGGSTNSPPSLINLVIAQLTRRRNRAESQAIFFSLRCVRALSPQHISILINPKIPVNGIIIHPILSRACVRVAARNPLCKKNLFFSNPIK